MLVMKAGELMGVEIKEDNISVSNRLTTSSKYKGKFARRDVKERYYKGRKHLMDCTNTQSWLHRDEAYLYK